MIITRCNVCGEITNHYERGSLLVCENAHKLYHIMRCEQGLISVVDVKTATDEIYDEQSYQSGGKSEIEIKCALYEGRYLVKNNAIFCRIIAVKGDMKKV